MDLRRQRGFVLLTAMLMLLLLAGMLGLAADTASLQNARQRVQTAADAAAIAAQFELQRGNTAGMLAAAEGDAARNGIAQPRVALANPPETGPYASNASAVQATVTFRATVTIMRIFGAADPDVSARAVAVPGPGGRPTLGE